jgi:hypothetical protein
VAQESFAKNRNQLSKNTQSTDKVKYSKMEPNRNRIPLQDYQSYKCKSRCLSANRLRRVTPNLEVLLQVSLCNALRLFNPSVRQGEVLRFGFGKLRQSNTVLSSPSSPLKGRLAAKSRGRGPIDPNNRGTSWRSVAVFVVCDLSGARVKMACQGPYLNTRREFVNHHSEEYASSTWI